MKAVSPAILDARVGQSMSTICENHYDTVDQNHCAHFVSHMLGLKLGTLCGDMEWSTRGTGASVRCNELYNLLLKRGPWKEAPSPSEGLLVFVTSASNVKNNVMSAAPKKHVGIVSGGAVYITATAISRSARKPASTLSSDE